MITRQKKRYLLVESSKPLNLEGADDDMLENELRKVLGDLGFVSANVRTAAIFNDNVFVLKINRGSEGRVALALSLIKSIGRGKIGFYTISTSGSINAIFKKCNKLYKS